MFLLLLQKLFILILCISSYRCNDAIDKEYKFTDVVRTIDLSSQLVKVTTTVTLKSTSKSQIKSLLWALDSEIGQNLSYISARDASKKPLLLLPTKLDDHKEDFFYVIALNEPAKSEFQFVVEEVYVGAQHPFPTAITQKQSQLVRYFGSYYLYSPYLVEEQVTKINLASRSVENYTKTKKVTVSSSSLTLGPFRKSRMFSFEKFMVHYENNSPFLTVTQLKRWIEISHWGNIAIEEAIDLLHTGAKLKGPFSHFDYQSSRTGNSVRSFKTILPASAVQAYYKDFNGNVSTSDLTVRRNSVELELRPRFPLFGGWKTTYTIGYNVPSYQYLYNKDNIYVLKIRVLDHIFDDMRVDELETSIVLPVGATDIQLKTPYSVERLPDSVVHKYLDPRGRTVLRFSKKNLVENHIQDFELTYRWSRAVMLHEPVLLSAALYAIFLVCIIYVRLNFAIHSDQVSESKKKK